MPDQSTVANGPTTANVGEAYTVTMQSYNGSGVSHDVADDTYTLTLSNIAHLGTYSGTATGVHQANGYYAATFSPNPTVMGTYDVTVNLSNAYTVSDSSVPTEIKMSPYTVEFGPGRVDPS